MFEITEKEATGEVAEIYQDIRETMNMPFPQTIWRNLATKEGALQWVWYSLKPIYQSGAVAHYASELRSSLDVPSVSTIPADIISIKGKEFMSAYKLREDGRSIRLYCNQCWSLIAVEHPAYQSNVFYILPKHCVTSCDLSVPLSAILFMKDYPEDYETPPEDDVPLFYSFEYKQERQRFSSLPTVANTFKRRTDPLKGINFTELVNSLGEPEILNLERGKRFI